MFCIVILALIDNRYSQYSIFIGRQFTHLAQIKLIVKPPACFMTLLLLINLVSSKIAANIG